MKSWRRGAARAWHSVADRLRPVQPPSQGGPNGAPNGGPGAGANDGPTTRPSTLLGHTPAPRAGAEDPTIEGTPPPHFRVPPPSFDSPDFARPDTVPPGDTVDDAVTALWRPGRYRVVIANRHDGGILYWTAKLYGFAALVLGAVLIVIGVATYGYFASEAPPTPDLAHYAEVVPAVSRIYAADGTLLGEFAHEWREVVPYDHIPAQLVNAFLAAEDHDFFNHHGIYFKGILRAVWRNLTAGDFAQGGSTITQQVAKQFLGAEKSLTRKAKEAIVARRLEAVYSKKAILSVYLNQIYLGDGAYGVEAAAQRYFSKNLDELDVGEAATIAGLAQAPSYYSPVSHPDRAKDRRNQILEKMARYGYLTDDQAKTWEAKPMVLHSYHDVFGDRLPYYAEHVRRYINDKYGTDALMKKGLTIEAAAEPVADWMAYDTVDFGTRKQDKRQGWRGPVAYLDEGRPREVFKKRASAMYGDRPMIPGRRYLGLVEEVSAREASVRVGDATYRLRLKDADWAAPWSVTDPTNDHTISSLTKALRVGDVIWVAHREPVTTEHSDWRRDAGSNPRWIDPPSPEKLERERKEMADEVDLEQVPHPEAVIFTGDHTTGYVVSMVGGDDFDRSQFNRAVQACRSPGSAYKPIYYSAALDQGYGYDTELKDVVHGEVDPLTGEVWTPQNYGGTVDQKVNLEYALVYSKNIPSIEVFKRIGADNVVKWARNLGFSTKLIADKALALGASCTMMDELARAYAIFARNGRWIDWVYVRRVLDRSGNVLEDNTVYYDPMLPAAARLDRVFATAGVRARQAIKPRTGYLISKLLAQVIHSGFSSIIRRTGLTVAGKTGTGSATVDTTFVGYTSRWLTLVWMGDDLRQRPLGKEDAAWIVVEPMFARYMSEASEGQPLDKIPWEVPPGVSPRDRGDHKGAQYQMSLEYRGHNAKPEDSPLRGILAPPEG